MPKRTVIRDGLSLLVLCALGVWIWQARLIAPATEPVSLFGSSDLFTYFHPMHQEAARRLAQGELPLWNPWQLAGLPFLATLQTGVFYPLNVLYLALPTERAMELLTLFHMLLAGGFAYGLGRALGLGRLPSMVGGLVYPWSSFLVSAHLVPAAIATLAWIPALFAAVARIHRGGGPGWSAALGGGVAMILLAGYMGLAVYGLQALALYALWNGIRTLRAGRGVKTLVREAGWVAAGVTLGVMLAAPQWIPTLELSGLSARSTEGLTDSQIEPFAYLQLSQWTTLFKPGSSPGGYVGEVALLLLLPGLMVTRLRTETAFFGGIAILAGILALGSETPLYELYKSLPTGRMFRLPPRFLSIFTFGAAVTASLGAEALLSPRVNGATRRLLMVGSVALTCAALIAVGLAHLPRLAIGASFLLGFVVFVPNRAIITAGVTIVAMIFGNLFLTTLNTQTQTWKEGASQLLREYDPLYEKLRNELHLQRAIIHVNLAHIASTSPKQASLHGLYLFEDYEPLVPRRYADYATYLQKGTLYQNLPIPYSGGYDIRDPFRFPRLLAAAGVAVEVTLEDDRGGTHRFRLKEIPGALPRAYVVHGVRAAVDRLETLRAIADGDLELESEVILESPPGSAIRSPGPAESGEWVRFLSYEPEAIVLEASLLRPGALVLLDADFPGWHAWVDGSSARIYNANYLFRALLLPAGTHHIVFRYTPQSVRIGLFVGATGLTLLVAFVALSFLNRKRNRR